MKLNKIYQEEALKTLKTFPDESVNMVMTSPPYWALRDYGVNGQLGLEKTFQEYINKLCNIFDEIKRVLRKDGTIWVNLGDTYGGNTGEPNFPILNPQQVKEHKSASKVKKSLQQKSLVLIPFRFVIEMVNRGWILRNVIIWHKPNCMPSSVKDRFTVDFDYLFFFVKNKKYWFETQREPNTEISIKRAEYEKRRKSPSSIGSKSEKYGMPARFVKLNPQGHNKRCVWTINTKSYPEAHFAVYPEKLCVTPIKAGCPEKGIVLDPFIGSGTTALVARKLNRNYIGIELNPEYIKLAEKRLKQQMLDL